MKAYAARVTGWILGTLALTVVVAIIAAYFITLIWGWVVPDVFRGAVAHGILPATLSIWQAFKLSTLLGFLGLTSKASSSLKSS